MEDMELDVAAKKGILKWSTCGLTNTERDVQRTIKRQKTKLEISIGSMPCAGCDLPWISPENWLRFIVQNGLWPTLAGVQRHDWEGARQNWSEFWSTYEQINPSFELFEVARSKQIDLSRTAAWLIHGDEGRTLKRGGLLVTSLQSALGRGYDQKRTKGQGVSKLQVNFAGHSFCTRYVISTVPKTSYDTQPEVFNASLENVAKSCKKLFGVGFVDRARGSECFRVVIIGVKGDAPYLSKAAHFYRSYNTAVKRGEERGPPKGCCPYCLAGTRLCAAEEIGTDSPQWLTTVAVKLPWIRQPALIKYLLHDRSDPSNFFKSDIWHIVHLGFGRSWVASVIQVALPVLPCANLDEKWEFLTDHYLQWCRANKKQAHISRITAYLMSYHDHSGAMGNWHKGALTTNFMQWLIHLLGSIPQDADGLLVECRCATYRMNSMFSLLYRAGAFLSRDECAFVAAQGLGFLKTYQKMAVLMFQASKQWCFPLYPKLHIFHHICIEVQRAGIMVGVGCNPTMWGCQMDEDCIGKASRLSRRVNIRRVAFRALDRYLIAAYSAFRKDGLLK